MAGKTLDVFESIKNRAKTLIGKKVCFSEVSGGYSAHAPSGGGCGIIKEVTDTHITFETDERFVTKPQKERVITQRIPIESIIGLTEKERIPKEWFE